MKKTFWAILTLWLCLGEILLPGSRKIKFEHITLTDGLSQNTANCILQDQEGFMWFGTEDGLNRYDGYKFKTYNSNPDDPHSLSVNYMWTIYEARSGIIWIGTWGGGLNKFDRSNKRFSRYLNIPGDPHSLSHNEVRAICEDRSGALWIGTKGGGLDKFDHAAEQFDHYKNEPGNNGSLSHNEVMAILEDSSGTLWIGTNGGGLNKFDSVTGRFIHFKNEPGNPHSLGHNEVTVIFEDHGGALWIGTKGGGLNKFNPATGNFTRCINDPENPRSLSSSQVTAIYEDAADTLWVGTNSGGLNRFDKETGEFTRFLNIPTDPDSLSTNDVRAIYEDKSNVLWVSTYSGGLNKRNRKKEKFTLHKAEPGDANSLSGNIVWSIYRDRKDFLWIGTNNGLNRFDRKTQRYTLYKNKPGSRRSLSNNQVRTIYEDSANTLWFGTDGGGLNKLDPDSGGFTRYKHDPANPHSLSSDIIRAIYEDRAGAFWIGTGNGFNRFDRSSGRCTRYHADPDDPHSLSHDFVYAILEDRPGNFWIGTWGGGLNKLDRKTGKFTRYQKALDDPNCLSNNLILSLYEDREGTLWIGTSGGGLNKFDRQTETFIHFRQKDGLPNDVIYGILEDDDGRLWFSTNKGLSGFNPRTGEFKNYSVIDGLQSNEFNGGAYHKSKNGEMFFGGINGFNSFFPAEIVEEEQYIPPIVITSFFMNNREIALEKAISETGKLQLAYKDNFISFEFAALDYTAPGRNRYAYKLENFNKDYIQTNAQKRFATYTRLPPGNYVFHVKGTNHDGKWNEAGTSLEIQILAPFWKTSWFIALLYLAAIALIFYIAWIREKAQKKAQLEKELKLKADFTAMLVHDLRSPLTSIMGYAEMMSSTPNIINNLEKTGEIISRSSEKMLNIINDMLIISKFEAGKISLDKSYTTLGSIVEETVHVMQPMLDMKQFKIKYDFPPLPQLFVDSEKITQVVNNFLSNAAKFSPKKGTITIGAKEIGANGNKLQELVVADEGPGVAPGKEPLLFNKYSQLHKDSKMKGTGLGLAVSKWIIESHRGEIGYRPRQGGGSVFYFRLHQPRK